VQHGWFLERLIVIVRRGALVNSVEAARIEFAATWELLLHGILGAWILRVIE
jgi:hypothetical protein